MEGLQVEYRHNIRQEINRCRIQRNWLRQQLIRITELLDITEQDLTLYNFSM